LYDELEDIFGHTDGGQTVTIDTAHVGNEGDIQNIDLEVTSGVSQPSGSFSTRQDASPLVVEEIIFQDESPATSRINSDSRTNRRKKGIYSRTGLSDVLELQHEILQMRNHDKEQELKLRNDELELSKEKFLFEKQKHADEINQKSAQANMERELKIMQMEMQKEIALKEIEVKREIELEKLKKM